MYNLGYELWETSNHFRIGRRKLGARDGIFCAIEEQEADERPEASQKNSNDEAVDQKEDHDLAPHDEMKYNALVMLKDTRASRKCKERLPQDRSKQWLLHEMRMGQDAEVRDEAKMRKTKEGVE